MTDHIDPRIEAAARAVDPEAWRESLPLHPDDRERLQSTARRNATAAIAAIDKAATITTVEELDALPNQTVVLNHLNEAVSKYGSDWFFPGIRHRFIPIAIALPARVIHWGTE